MVVMTRKLANKL